MKTKRALRQQLIQQRNFLNPKDKINLSSQICEQILSHTVFKQSQRIAFYHAFGNEVDLSVIVNIAQDKLFYLPVIGKDNSMVFNHYSSDTDLTKNKYGISEPMSGETTEASDIELCLVPLVGFNRRGERLGMGGGYYDRYFQTNKAQKKPTILAGVAYDFQENATIQAESWDIPLDIIFTNKEVIIP